MTSHSALQQFVSRKPMKAVGLAADHGGLALKEYLGTMLRAAGAETVDFGGVPLVPEDDYPDFVVPLARAVAAGQVERGVAICGSGVGACIVANKVQGVRACLIHDHFSAHQGVEDDDLNLICLGGIVIGQALAWELVQTFLVARFSGKERHRRRLGKVAALERQPARTGFRSSDDPGDTPVHAPTLRTKQGSNTPEGSSSTAFATVKRSGPSPVNTAGARMFRSPRMARPRHGPWENDCAKSLSATSSPVRCNARKKRARWLL